MLVFVFFGVKVWAKRIEFCREGRLNRRGDVCCPSKCKVCGTQRCSSPRHTCCASRLRGECRTVNSVDCMVNGTASMERTPRYSGACGSERMQCGAVLLTGHMRTFEETRASVLEHVVKANAIKWDFDLVVATYATQDTKPRYHDKSRHSTAANAEITWERVYGAYQAAEWRAVVIHVFRDDEIGAILPRDMKRQVPQKLEKAEHLEQVARIKRSLALVQQGVIMVRELAKKRHKPHDAILRLRPDIELLRPLRVDALMPYVRRSFLVVPADYDPRGGLAIQAKQLVTRPCALNASLAPTWVQDHLALAASHVMYMYARFYHTYLKPHIFSSHVETALAKYLAPLTRISCVPTIKYTILR